MTGLIIFYCCLLAPSLIYFVISVFGGDTDVDVDAPTDGVAVTVSSDNPFGLHGVSDFRFTLSSLCYFLIGFSIAGLLFVPYGTLVSIGAGLITGVFCYFSLDRIFRYIVSFCFSGEVGMVEPEIGDECITLNNIGTNDVGLVRIFKRVGVDNHIDKTMTYFAVSNEGVIKLDTSCVVTRIEGNRVVVKPVQVEAEDSNVE